MPASTSRRSHRTARRSRSPGTPSPPRQCAPRMTLQHLRFGDQPSIGGRGVGSPAELADLVQRRRRADRHRRPERARTGIPRRRGDVDGHPTHRRRFRLHRCRRRARRRALRVAEFVCGTATSGPHRPRRRRHGAAVRRLAHAARNIDRSGDDDRRRDDGAILAGAARQAQRRPRCCCGCTVARWAAGTAGPGDGTRG